MQTGLTGHSRLIHDNWVTHVLRMNGWWASTIPRDVKVKSRHVRNLRPQNLPLISLLQACGMSEYVSIIILVRRSVSRDRLVYTHEIMHSNQSIIRYDRAYIWIILSIYTDSGTRWNTGWLCRLPWQQNTRFNRVTGEQRPEPGDAEPFSHTDGLCWHVLGPGLLLRRKYCRESFILKRVKKSLW
jgi:hypothetical protein